MLELAILGRPDEKRSRLPSCVPHADAQTSPGYKLTEHAANEGGRPEQGFVASSTSFRVTLDAIGGGVLGAPFASASFRIGGGFVGSYPPPAEVLGVIFVSGALLQWSPEGSVGTYALYRDTAPGLTATLGACLAGDLAAESYIEGADPAIGTAYVYLVRARNLLRQEGTKGKQSSGAERPNGAPCP